MPSKVMAAPPESISASSTFKIQPMPAPVIKTSLRDQIVEQLRNDVLCGRLNEGARLNEVALAKQFGVSRTPIREAIQQLTHEGLLHGQPNIGVKVSGRAPDSIQELVIPIRRSLEIYALKACFDSLNDSDFKAWDALLEKMREACLARDFHTIAEQDIAFHRSIIRRAGQGDLEAIWALLVSRVRHHFWESQSRDYDEPLAIYQEHRRIIDVFREGDLDSAVAALTENIA